MPDNSENEFNELTKDYNSLAEENEKLHEQLKNENHENKPKGYS